MQPYLINIMVVDYYLCNSLACLGLHFFLFVMFALSIGGDYVNHVPVDGIIFLNYFKLLLSQSFNSLRFLSNALL